MSRSALQKQMLKEQQQQQQVVASNPMMMMPGAVGFAGYPGYAVPNPPMPSVGYAPASFVPAAATAAVAVNFNHPAYAAVHMNAMMQVPPNVSAGIPPVMAPIPLTGDEDEDNAADAMEAKANALPMHGNTTNFNINSLLHNNIMENEYFRALYQLRTYHEVIDEIQRSVQHVEPWQMGTARLPSSAFCLLLKFMLMRMTRKQMNGLLQDENPLVRCIGLLYLRYTCPPKDLWKWFEPFLEESEEFAPSADKSVKVTFGTYCTGLLTDMQYYGTTLPRIPVLIEREIKVLLLLLGEKKRRRSENLRQLQRARGEALEAGAKVRAIYSDADNEPAWYDAVIDSLDADAAELGQHKYWVTFPEYGNSECVDLGDIELINSSGGGAAAGSSKSSRSDDRDRDRGDSRDRRDRDRHRNRRSNSRDRDRHRDSSRRSARSRSRSRSRDRSGSNSRDGDSSGRRVGAADLMQKVLESERLASAAVGRNYGQRPASYKGSLSLKQDRYTVRRKSPSPVSRRETAAAGGRRRQRSASRSRSPPRAKAAAVDNSEYIRRMKQLKERYGDASAAK